MVPGSYFVCISLITEKAQHLFTCLLPLENLFLKCLWFIFPLVFPLCCGQLIFFPPVSSDALPGLLTSSAAAAGTRATRACPKSLCAAGPFTCPGDCSLDSDLRDLCRPLGLSVKLLGAPYSTPLIKVFPF